jgi:hypothetical protein
LGGAKITSSSETLAFVRAVEPCWAMQYSIVIITPWQSMDGIRNPKYLKLPRLGAIELIMKQEIQISFTQLRTISKGIIDLIGNISGKEVNEINIQTSINYDLGIDGDDWDAILLALYKRENLQLDGLNFYDYFSDEEQIANNGVVALFFFPFRVILYFLTLRWRYKPFKDFATMSGPLKQSLTIGDIVTSKLEGRFIRREARRYVYP